MTQLTSNVLQVRGMMWMIEVNINVAGGDVAVCVPLLTGGAHVDSDRRVTPGSRCCVFVVTTVGVSFGVRIRTKAGTRILRD